MRFNKRIFNVNRPTHIQPGVKVEYLGKGLHKQEIDTGFGEYYIDTKIVRLRSTKNYLAKSGFVYGRNKTLTGTSRFNALRKLLET